MAQSHEPIKRGRTKKKTDAFLLFSLSSLSLSSPSDHPKAMTDKTVTGPSSDVLLSIFSHLDFRHRPIERAVCKDWLAVVDNNKSLWRVFEWIQKEKESPRTIVNWFDDKSGSSLEEVSISYKPKPPKPPVISYYYIPQHDEPDYSPELQEEQLHLLDVILKSSPSLRMVSIRMQEVKGDNEKVKKILASSPRLNKLVFWEDADPQGFFPISRLFPSRSNPPNELKYCGDLV